MKKFIFCVVLTVFAAMVNAQPVAKTFSTATPVKILGWGTRSSYFISGYWEMAIPQLKKKLNQKLVDSIERYSSDVYYPWEFNRSLNKAEAKPDKNDLKMYLVATFDNNFNGTFHGVINVIWVPRAENKNWGTTGNSWENDFFLILPKDAVTGAL